jgi:hypothetical protein
MSPMTESKRTREHEAFGTSQYSLNSAMLRSGVAESKKINKR